MDKKIIAVMGTGPLGLWTADYVLKETKASEVLIRIGNRQGKAPGWMPENVRIASKEGWLNWQAVDALHPESIRNFAEGSSALVHSAIPAYHEWISLLPIIQRNAIEAAVDAHARLICADNLYAYAPPVTGPLTEDSKVDPPSRKGQLRKEMKDMMLEAQKEQGLMWSTLQASQYFGPGAGPQSVFGDNFIDPVMRKAKVRFFGDPSLRHAWGYAADIGRAMGWIALTDNEQLLNCSWIVPHVSHAPARDLAQLFFDKLEEEGLLPDGTDREIGAISASEVRESGLTNPILREREEMLYQFLMHFEASGEKFASATGFEPTPLDQAIAATVAYWKEVKFRK